MAEKRNIAVLIEIRIGGKKVKAGTVISKDEFKNKGAWQNLCNMEPPRCKETNKEEGYYGSKRLAPGMETDEEFEDEFEDEFEEDDDY